MKTVKKIKKNYKAGTETGRLAALIRFLLITILMLFITVKGVFAYIDPGSGSFFFQMLIASLLGFVFTIKVYWKKITAFLGRKKKDDITELYNSEDLSDGENKDNVEASQDEENGGDVRPDSGVKDE